jgi:hypothetical protein
MADQFPYTVNLNNGLRVLAKYWMNDLYAMTYTNRTQAVKKVQQLGEGWYVWRGTGRPFYVVYDPCKAENI